MLVVCQECSADISDAAASCPKCGAPPEAYLGARRKCAECEADYRTAYSDCRNCGAPRDVALGTDADGLVTELGSLKGASTQRQSAAAPLRAAATAETKSNITRSQAGWLWFRWAMIIVGITFATRLLAALTVGDSEAIVGTLVGFPLLGLIVGGLAYGLGYLFSKA